MKPKPRRNTNAHLAPLQPESTSASAFPHGYHVQSAQIASLESRVNGQQKRLNAQDAFIDLLKKELYALKSVVRDMGAPLKPAPLDRPARKGKF